MAARPQIHPDHLAPPHPRSFAALAQHHTILGRMIDRARTEGRQGCRQRRLAGFRVELGKLRLSKVDLAEVLVVLGDGGYDCRRADCEYCRPVAAIEENQVPVAEENQVPVAVPQYGRRMRDVK
jgi:hypothetical protein